uniref:PBP domain-containing protein n=1 Tax=Amphora coffeiformis TaxID=265554 RepID=A0A7S3L500_9STRA|mmetsp:Transcript_7125/g.13625  ORF Transcript_7125/g.13625 Transcript_7125/m.13625 type:complete len:472 (-) Transcript_7125:318-1733(-)|eukprot:scaffold6781_cov204-Amphora_coffeaeformis.AAC.29
MFKSLFATAALLAAATVTTAHQDVLNIHGSGTTNPSKCIWAIMEDFMDQSKHPIRMTYRAVGSGTGIAEFINGNSSVPAADFGSGDLPLPKDAYDGLIANNVGVLHLPILLSAVSVFHNVPGLEVLDLDACLLARIFSRKIKSWGDEAIVVRNPSLDGSTLQISVARRVLGSSSTDSITNYLCKACPQEWDLGVGPLIEWPEDTLPCEGSGGVTTCITELPGTIGYLDAGHGHAEGLPEIELVNLNGTSQNSKKAGERGGIASAMAEAEGELPTNAREDWSNVSLLNRPGQYTWPIVLLTYIYVREDLSYLNDPDEQTLLKAFLKALYDDNYVQQCVSDHDFTLPPASIKNFAVAAIDSLAVSENATEWTIESSTAPIVATGDFVISQKRRTHNEVERDVLMDQVAELMLRVAEMEVMVSDSQIEMQRVADDNFDKDAMLTISLVLGIIGTVLSLMLAGCFLNQFFHKPHA